ncbi:MAG: serine/threonine-protein kinase, partial [Acidobacteriota bacterium]
SMARDEDTLKGRQIGDKYVLGERLGEGGMGVVYAAEQRGLDRTVAVKLLRAELAREPHVLHRFVTEARAGSKLSHRNLVTVHDFGELPDGSPYLVMEHVRGEPLSTLLAAFGPLSPHRAAELVGQVLAGLAEAHLAGIVHGDVKTDNVIVERARDGSELAKLVDFGLASFTDDPPPLFGSERMLSGTPEYLAPEVVLGAVPTPASDVYGAGIVLYELLTGTTPFCGGTTAEILARHLDEDVVPPSLRNPERAIPAALERVVLRALEKLPVARYRDARAFAAALAAAAPEDEQPEPAIGAAPTIGFSTEAPTRDLSHEQLPANIAARRRLATGTGAHAATPTLQLRHELGDAIARGAVDEIVAGYLDLARALVDERRLPDAAAELAEAVDLLTRGGGPLALDAPEPVWRVLLALAAIYAGIGDAPRARQAATAAHELATRVHSVVGTERAYALLQRFARAPRGA